MNLGIKQAIKDGNGTTIINTALIAAALANVLPTAADGVYFWRQAKDKEALDKGEITPKQYWIRDVLGYYGYTAAYYTIILLSVQAIGGTYKTKSRILLALLGGGVVVGVVSRNIQKATVVPPSNKTPPIPSNPQK